MIYNIQTRKKANLSHLTDLPKVFFVALYPLHLILEHVLKA